MIATGKKRKLERTKERLLAAKAQKFWNTIQAKVKVERRVICQNKAEQIKNTIQVKR